MYVKTVLVILGLVAFVFTLYIAQGIIIPLVFATILAIVLHPAVSMIIRLKVHRVVAIGLVMLLTFSVIALFGTLLYSQASRFTESFPKLVDKFTQIINQLIFWTSGYFDISANEITQWITNTKNELIGSDEIGQTIVGVGSILAFLFLIPVYVFMILFYQPLLIEFLHRLFGENNRSKVSEIINQIKTLIQRYLIGLLFEVVIISFLYTIGLLILGIEYALVLGILGALLNLIPYLGSIIAASMPMIIAIVTKPSPWFAVLVLALYIFIQFIDNNYIVPKIVASKVKLNALASIIAVITFGALWGIPGMLVAIPLTAIAKLIFDHIKPLQSWGFLLGDNLPD
ncbi:putative PurR-regulated permease PerM [Marinilabilia salmonicolor]|jgi:predicted PurR-regulated permease PerM|uniref:Putative PurR-regulated permease PerM n=2 Tax=Marinilabilia salmonicolor TaxID=989 RepID=A0A2T0XH34_9BACT|nr:putative PurR-regulated permease PerM [Marinilabilia salmonicolor]RCW29227.1 putative PurR-regulated permease PerM [Marinilabilia salmonicolor]